MQAQLTQAQRSSYEALWWTEHDWRLAAHGYLSHLPVSTASTGGLTWRRSEGSAGEHHFADDAPSRSGTGAMSAVRVQTAGSPEQPTEYRLLADSEDHLYRTSLHGQLWTVLVHPELLEAGRLGLDLRTSWRPTTEDKEEGFYWLSYRFGAAATTTVRERWAKIGLQAQSGEWTEFTLNPADDFASAWPELDGRDASCVEISLLAEAQPGGSAEGYFGDISITRSSLEGDAPLAVHRELMERYARDYPTVQQLQGLEVSLGTPHLCWYGGKPCITHDTKDSSSSMISEIRAGGGVASYTHPFGVGSQPSQVPANVSRVAPVLATLLGSGIRDCDALEVGYRQRGGATLALHESLWDALSRRGIFVTGLGVNDDHIGRDWTEGPNNFGSWLWAPSTEEEDLVTALRSGYAHFGDPTLFSGQLDIRPVAGGRMGNVLLGSGTTSEVRLVAQGLPGGSSLELLRLGMVSDAQPVDPDEMVILTVPTSDLDQGALTTSVNSAADCLVRTRVRDSSGEVIALSNPVWFVEDEATYAVPRHRTI